MGVRGASPTALRPPGGESESSSVAAPSSAKSVPRPEMRTAPLSLTEDGARVQAAVRATDLVGGLDGGGDLGDQGRSAAVVHRARRQQGGQRHRSGPLSDHVGVPILVVGDVEDTQEAGVGHGRRRAGGVQEGRRPWVGRGELLHPYRAVQHLVGDPPYPGARHLAGPSPSKSAVATRSPAATSGTPALVRL